MAKRLLDVLLAAAGLCLGAPFWAAIGLAVKLSSRGPVLYRATRVGKGGDSFIMHKFRTMREQPAGAGLRITSGGDARVTKVGKALRASKLDEAPQLWDVLMGHMSLVGPRPEDPHYIAMYDERQRKVLSVRPGMTGPTALVFRHEEALLAASGDPETTYVTEILPQKLELDLQYVETRSFWGDLAIMIRTLAALFRTAQKGMDPFTE